MPQTERYCFTLDLVDDEQLIAEYEARHARIWPEVLNSFAMAGIEHLEMYRSGNRVMMLFDVNDQFSFEKKAQIDRNDPKIGEWEALMSRYQKAAPGALADEKWVLMKRFVKI